MRNDTSDGFFVSVLDSLAQQMAVIDADGLIQWVNDAWHTFAKENGGGHIDWGEISYLRVCHGAADRGDADGREALAGIQSVIRGDQPAFSFEYPCHSPSEQRWFTMRICPIAWGGPRRFVVTHYNITLRKLAELQVEELAVIDSLTGIANRRRFDAVLEDEWRRARRMKHPVSLLLLDIDFFKAFNDTYGHRAGDDCLRRVGEALRPFSRRPDDLVARYGGEEFAVILGDTAHHGARQRAEEIRAVIQALNIRHEASPAADGVTVSVGVATRRPHMQPAATPADLIEAADKALYDAKQKGRNRVCVNREPPPLPA